MKSVEDDFLGILGFGIVFGVIAFVIFAAVFALPFFLVGAAIWGGVYYHYHSPGYLEKKSREHTHALYREALVKYRAADPEALVSKVFLQLPDTSLALATRIAGVASDLIQQEQLAAVPEPPLLCNSLEGARYRDKLSRLTEFPSPDRAIEVLLKAFRQFLLTVPDLPERAPFRVPLIDLLKDHGQSIEALIFPFYDEPGLFVPLKKMLDTNLTEVSPRKETVLPSAYDGENIAYAYLKDTPLLTLLDAQVPFGLPETTRFEHHWIVSPPGTGKSTTLQCLLHDDFDKVAAGEASVIVMESNRDLIKAVERLERFGPGGDLEGRLLLIDCEDVEWPIALNLFDIGLEHIEEASPRDREALFNSAIGMLDYVFRALLGAELTSRQSTLFNFAIQFLIHIPGATLDTLIDLMQPRGIDAFSSYLPKLDADALRFFELKFNADEFRQTKSQVVDRLFAVKRIRTLSRMFAAPRTKLNLYTEMGKGRVILINCAKSLLQEEGVEIVSRFFLAMILLAAEKRQLLPPSERLPTYVYIDECQDVIRRDEKLPIILDQARKFRVAMVLAHQRLEQMQPSVLNALHGSTAIKFAAKLNDNALARQMNTTAEFIRGQPNYSYAVHIRGHTDRALSLRIPHVDMNNMPRLTDAQFQDIRERMRECYAVHQRDMLRQPSSQEEQVDNQIDALPDRPTSDW